MTRSCTPAATSAAYTISNNDFGNDPSDDLGVLTDWFYQGGKHAFMTGDDLAFSLTVSGIAARTFLTRFLGVDVASTNLRPLIGNQTMPRVEVVPGNSLNLVDDAAWYANGGCPGINDFDAVIPVGGAETFARFCNPAGEPDYPYAAAVRYTSIGDVVLLPYDLPAIVDAPDWSPPASPVPDARVVAEGDAGAVGSDLRGNSRRPRRRRLCRVGLPQPLQPAHHHHAGPAAGGRRGSDSSTTSAAAWCGRCMTARSPVVVTT